MFWKKKVEKEKEPWKKLTDLILKAANGGRREYDDTNAWIRINGEECQYSLHVSFGYCVHWTNETTYYHNAIHLVQSIGRNGLMDAPDDLIDAIIDDLPNILEKLKEEGINSRKQLKEQREKEDQRLREVEKKKKQQCNKIKKYLEGII